jgi:putative membrane protein
VDHVVSVRGALLGWCVVCAAWSGLGCKDRGVWAFELVPGALAVAALLLTWPRFRFRGFAYACAGAHFLVLAVGAKYTYAEVPLFDTLAEWLGWRRNPFDRLGHFLQGFVPAVFLLEWFVRASGMRRGRMLRLTVVACALAFSAFYEILEMAMVLVFYPAAGPEWLGSQGDPFDAQWDMVMALAGAVLAVWLPLRWPERALPGAVPDGAP